MTSKLIVNNIEADAGVSTITFGSEISASKITTSSGDFTVGTGASVYSPTTNVLALGTNNAERVRIDSSGNIGIGSQSPRYSLDISGGNLLVSGSAAGNLILEDRSVADGSRPFALLASNDGNFTITNANRNASDQTTSSVERLRITSDGDIGIGLTNPSTNLHIKDGAPAIRLQATNLIQRDYDIKTDGNEIYIEGVGGSSGSLQVGENGVYSFRVDMGCGDTKFYLNSSGNVELGGNLIFASGQGIDFSANGNAAGMTSELLDDYEEGTWTPTVFPASGSFTSFSYQVRSGSYTKIGNMVYLRCNFYTNGVTVGTASGNLAISGLPFSAGNVAGGCLHDVRHWANNPSTVTITGSLALIYRRTSFNGNDGRMQVTDLGTGNPGNLCQFSGSYQIS